MNKDLTVGRPAAVLWRFCLPLFAGMIFQQLYSIADSLIAGKYVGNDALAAVGNSYEITLIFIAFGFGLNIGCSVVTARLFGGKRYADLKTAVRTVLIAGSVICAALMAGGPAFCDGLLRLIRTPDNIFADSRLYLIIYIYSLPFVLFYNVSTGIFSALGDARTPFWFLACSSTANIGMDILFVTVFDMGVAGVAWATFICQGVSCVLALLFVLLRLRGIRTEEKAAVFSWRLLGEVAVIAVPSFLQQSFISVGNIIIQGVINGFGSGVIAGYSASVKLNNMVISSLTTLGSGVSNFTAQNIGAGKFDRIPEGFRAGIRLILCICLPICFVYVLGARGLMWLFLEDPTGEAMRTGMIFLRLLAPFYIVIASKLVADGVLRGSGMMKEFMTATFTDLILRVLLAILLSRTSLGSVGIWLSWPIGWTIATVMSVLFYKSGRWR
ncbi:MAG: MATE family efflux transporter [Clostridia bacterium]|nr:MATE family efflux transporter [Clostridia bacterium]